MTSSYCIDILGMQKDQQTADAVKRKKRLTVHLSFAFLFFLCVLIFKWIDDKSIIDVILKLAGYTYGPLLGMFTFGMFTRRHVTDKWVIWVCLASPLLVLGIDLVNNAEWFVNKLALEGPFAEQLLSVSEMLFSGFKIGIEILIINGLLTFLGLMLISSPKKSV